MLFSLASVRVAAPVAALLLVAAACGDSSEDAAAVTTSEAPATTAAAATTEAPASTQAPATTAAPAGGDAGPVGDGQTISVHYVGTLDDGEQFDSSRDRGQPLTFVVGSGQMIPGFDAAVHGMVVGEIKTVRLDAADAYGERSDDFLIEARLDQIPAGTEAGDTLVSASGQSVTVLSIEGDVVTLDTNHRLAGQDLTFEIEIVEILP
ncbi:MAG: peptidylprolyl isomerase [Acidimicrobiia bacterium]